MLIEPVTNVANCTLGVELDDDATVEMDVSWLVRAEMMHFLVWQAECCFRWAVAQIFGVAANFSVNMVERDDIGHSLKSQIVLSKTLQRWLLDHLILRLLACMSEMLVLLLLASGCGHEHEV